MDGENIFTIQHRLSKLAAQLPKFTDFLQLDILLPISEKFALK
jgi:hypothetical protein